MRTLAAGKRGHVASAFSLVEILRVLYDDVLRYDPQQPRWQRARPLHRQQRARLPGAVRAAGGKGLLSPRTSLWRFCHSDGILGGHPEAGKVPGVEASTGSLGHGLSIGVGLALSAAHDGARPPRLRGRQRRRVRRRLGLGSRALRRPSIASTT